LFVAFHYFNFRPKKEKSQMPFIPSIPERVALVVASRNRLAISTKNRMSLSRGFFVRATQGRQFHPITIPLKAQHRESNRKQIDAQFFHASSGLLPQPFSCRNSCNARGTSLSHGDSE
jgi:hypothetical protein